jgi:dTDP-4-dehydrorhamnose reductase
MQNILVTGGNGQVGSELQVVAQNQSVYQFFFTDAADLDITNQAAVLAYFQKNNIHTCINCAAYTAVDKAESSPAIAKKVNVDGAENLAKACTENGAKLIHLSTDYVYHNQQNTPFKEGDATNPQGVYAQTKLDGDLVAMATCPNTVIMRTSWVYSSFGNNFVKTMIRLGNERDALNVVFDQIGTPTYAKDIAEAAFAIIQSIDNQSVTNDAWQGVFHYSNEGVTSWYDFAQAIFDIEKIDCKLGAIESVQYPTPAKRPPFSVLNKGKIKAVFQLDIPHWRTSLVDCLSKLR